MGDLLSAETVVLKMVLAYNKRKQGSEYLKTTLAPLIQQVVKQQGVYLLLTTFQYGYSLT